MEMSKVNTIFELKYNRSVLITDDMTTFYFCKFYNEFGLRRTDGNGSISMIGLPVHKGLNRTIKRQLSKMYAN